MRCLLLAIAAAGLVLPAAATAHGPVEDLERALLCGQASDEATIAFFLNTATPGEVFDGLHLVEEEKTVETCVVSGGAVTWKNLDYFIWHQPVSDLDVLAWYRSCFNQELDQGGVMLFLDEYRLRFRYDATTGDVRASADDGGNWRDCNAAVEERTPEWAAIPWSSYLHTNANGVLLVRA